MKEKLEIIEHFAGIQNVKQYETVLIGLLLPAMFKLYDFGYWYSLSGGKGYRFEIGELGEGKAFIKFESTTIETCITNALYKLITERL